MAHNGIGAAWPLTCKLSGVAADSVERGRLHVMKLSGVAADCVEDAFFVSPALGWNFIKSP